MAAPYPRNKPAAICRDGSCLTQVIGCGVDELPGVGQVLSRCFGIDTRARFVIRRHSRLIGIEKRTMKSHWQQPSLRKSRPYADCTAPCEEYSRPFDSKRASAAWYMAYYARPTALSGSPNSSSAEAERKNPRDFSSQGGWGGLIARRRPGECCDRSTAARRAMFPGPGKAGSPVVRYRG
jgi:hypothetical protein